MAARPKTLPAAAAPVAVGTALAIRDGGFRLGPALAALAGALLLQIGSNLSNDLFDFRRGADAGERLGPTRVTQAGLRTPQEMGVATAVIFGLAAAVGLYLVVAGGWPILVVGLFAIASAIAYTGGPFPLGYHGLGELFVFVFFGLAAVCGTYYVQVGRLTTTVWWSAVPVGLLVTAILVVNNLRDIESDGRVGKRTLAVRLGVRGSHVEYLLLLLVSYLVPLLMLAVDQAEGWILLAWLSAPMAWTQINQVLHHQGRALNLALAGTARLALVYSLLLAVGLTLPGLLII